MARDYDGSGDYDVFSNPTIFNGLSAFTLTSRVNLDALTADGTLFIRYLGGTGGFIYQFDDVGSQTGRTDTFTIFVQNGGNSAKIEGATNAAGTGSFQTVTVTYIGGSSTGLRLYIDGVEDANSPASTTSVSALPSFTGDLGVGASAAGGGLLNGQLAECAAFDRSFTGEEAAGLNNNFTPDHYGEPIFWTRLIRGTPVDRTTGATATVNGTPADFAHPPVIERSRPMIGHNVGAAPVVTARAPQMALMGVGGD